MTGKVVSLSSFRSPPEAQESSSFATEVMDEILSNTAFSENIKLIVEGKVAEVIMQILMSRSNKLMDDPFDPIFLYDLQPDEISDTTFLSAYSHIQDISDEIEFDDGWD